MKSSELFKSIFETTHTIGRELMDDFEAKIVHGEFADDITDGADEHVYNITHDIMSFYITHIEHLLSASLAQSLVNCLDGETDVDLSNPAVVLQLSNEVHDVIGD